MDYVVRGWSARMGLSRPLGALATLAVALTVIGALVSLVTGPVVGTYALAAIVVLAVVVVSVGAAVALGTGARETSDRAGYW